MNDSKVCLLLFASQITVITSKAWVLQFAKRTRTSYYAGTGTRIVRTHDVPIILFFLNIGTVTVRRWYS